MTQLSSDKIILTAGGTGGHIYPAEALAVEDSASVAAETYANIIAVKAGNENSEKIKVLIDALKSEAVKKYIEENYGGAVVPVF